MKVMEEKTVKKSENLRAGGSALRSRPGACLRVLSAALLSVGLILGVFVPTSPQADAQSKNIERTVKASQESYFNSPAWGTQYSMKNMGRQFKFTTQEGRSGDALNIKSVRVYFKGKNANNGGTLLFDKKQTNNPPTQVISSSSQCDPIAGYAQCLEYRLNPAVDFWSNEAFLVTVRGSSANKSDYSFEFMGALQSEDKPAPQPEPEPEKPLEFPRAPESAIAPRVANPNVPKRCGLRIAIVADMSSSLSHGDTNGWEASRQAANAMVDSLQSSFAQVGIYNFGSTAPARLNVGDGTTADEEVPYFDVRDSDGVAKVREAIDQWGGGVKDGEYTNWEAGLQQVQGQGYDLVYFITDGMPTTDAASAEKNYQSAFMGIQSLNAAVKAANVLKNEGTRIVPLYVDVLTGDNRPVVDELLLKPMGWQWDNRAGYLSWDGTGKVDPKYFEKARYKDSADTMVNFLNGMLGGAWRITRVGADGSRKDITRNTSEWTYGIRSVKQTVEDISGPNVPVHIARYSDLASQLKSIADDIANNCGGISVTKRIVDEQGNVLEDGKDGWTFTAEAENPVLDVDGKPALQGTKVTATDGVKRGYAQWKLVPPETGSAKAQPLKIRETLEGGYRLYPRDGANAVCTQTLDGVTSPAAVTNIGNDAFRVTVPANGGRLASVNCVVDNVQPPAPKTEISFGKAVYSTEDGGQQILDDLGGAEFGIYEAGQSGPGALVSTITHATDTFQVTGPGSYYLVEQKAPSGYSLLPLPVRFDVVADPDTKKLKVIVGDGKSPFVTASGEAPNIKLTVVDTHTGTLPRTGSVGVLPAILAGLIIMGLGAAVARKRLGAL